MEIEVLESPRNCARACRIVEILHNEGVLSALEDIFQMGSIPSSKFHLAELAENNKNLKRLLETSTTLRSLLECTCNDHECVLPRDDWSWEHHFPLSNARLFGKNVMFHPRYSFGSAAIRGEQALDGSTLAYWEIYGLQKIYGTSIMFGIGSQEATLSAGCRFVDLIGWDEHSYGLNHQGFAFHGGYSFRVCDPIPSTGHHSVGVFFNGPARTLSYFVDGTYVGTPFVELDTSRPLYPMISSTAQQSEFVVMNQYRWGRPCSLFRLALQRVHRDTPTELLHKLPLPQELKKQLLVFGTKRTSRQNYSKRLEELPLHGRNFQYILDQTFSF